MVRVLSAIVLLAIVGGTIWFLPPVATVLLAAVAAVLAFIEYGRLAESLGARVPRLLGATAVAAAALAAGGLLAVDVALLSAFLAIGVFAVAHERPGPGVLRDIAASALPLVYIGLPLGSLAAVRVLGGREALMLLLVTIVVSDSAQYYSGRLFGRRALAPAISPKKTIEGAVGGVVLGTTVMTLGGLQLFPEAGMLWLLLASAAVVLLGIAGDLFESLLKRSAGVKDSSHIIPGHGGILDRIDSWLFAGPVYYIFIRSLQA